MVPVRLESCLMPFQVDSCDSSIILRLFRGFHVPDCSSSMSKKRFHLIQSVWARFLSQLPSTLTSWDEYYRTPRSWFLSFPSHFIGLPTSCLSVGAEGIEKATLWQVLLTLPGHGVDQEELSSEPRCVRVTGRWRTAGSSRHIPL